MSKIANIDRRVIYLLLIAVIALALLRPIGLAIVVSPETMKVYNAIDNIPSGSIIWMGFDFDAGAIPELMPAAKMVVRQAFQKDLRIVAGGMWQMSGDVATQAFEAVAGDFPNKQYGVDWVNIGYRPGTAVWLDQMVQDVWRAAAGQDAYGRKFEELPLMAEFKSMKSAEFIMEFSTGTPGGPEYIKTVSGPLGTPMGQACTSVEVPGTMPYISSGQLIGGVLGMKGAAEYETIMGKPGSATAGMDAQSFAHALIIGFILLGNVGYVIDKRKAR